MKESDTFVLVRAGDAGGDFEIRIIKYTLLEV
jgi:hypothetical protein